MQLCTDKNKDKNKDALIGLKEFVSQMDEQNEMLSLI